MDGQTHSIAPHQAYERLGTGSAPLSLDVRRPDVFGSDDGLIQQKTERSAATA